MFNRVYVKKDFIFYFTFVYGFRSLFFSFCGRVFKVQDTGSMTGQMRVFFSKNSLRDPYET